MTAEINELREDIAEGQGTIVERGGEMLTRYPVDNVVETTDTITIEGGDV